MRSSRGQTERPRAPLLQLCSGARDFMCRIGGRLGSMGASSCGANLEIPPLKSLASNRGPLSGSGTLHGGLTSRAETKVGHSDPVAPRGRAIAQRIKGTPGITG
ncbi:hypothetical protein Lal_00013664 [Lupinus albus]|nr:hypothetical protein Lal_00013663 [Lupinus albus]KAF1852270.1 hypothetical protein Lal_00013664 [Lupinus albus]